MSDNGSETSIELYHHAEQIDRRLREIGDLLESTNSRIAIAGQLDKKVFNWPIPGVDRWTISDRRVSGSDGLTIPNQATPATLVCPANFGRIGGSIINSGNTSCTIYLCEPGRFGPGVGALWLGSSGGSWDFRLSEILWAGPVCAIASGGSTTLIWAQV